MHSEFRWTWRKLSFAVVILASCQLLIAFAEETAETLTDSKCSSSQMTEQVENFAFKWVINRDGMEANGTFLATTQNITFNSKIVSGNWRFFLLKYSSPVAQTGLYKLQAVYYEPEEPKGAFRQVTFEVTPEFLVNGQSATLQTIRHSLLGHSTNRNSGFPSATSMYPMYQNFMSVWSQLQRYFAWNGIFSTLNITDTVDMKELTLKFKIKTLIVNTKVDDNPC